MKLKNRYTACSSLIFLLVIGFSCGQKVKSKTESGPEPKIANKSYYSIEDGIKEPLKVKVLDLTSMGYKTLPKDIFRFKNLENLSLYHNNLKALPKDMVKFKNLKELSLEKNPIRTLSKQICAMPNLKVEPASLCK